MLGSLVILQFVLGAIAQFHFVVPVVQHGAVMQRRAPFVRTNCCPPCFSQNRCRWNQRPNGIPVISGPPVPVIPGPPVPVIQPQPVRPTQPPTPPQPTQTTTNMTTTTITTTTSFPTLVTQPTTGSEHEPNTTINTTPSERISPPATSNDPNTPSGSNFSRPAKKINPGVATPQPKTNQFVNPCSTGKPFLNAYGTAISCNFMLEPNGGCPDGYWCHTGGTFATTACCPNREKESRCSLPRLVGEGEDIIARWYFDMFTRQCKRFLYKGLYGNANNFISKAQCQATCTSQTASSSSDPNPCRYGTPALGSNQNKLICGPVDASQCPKGYYCHIGENPATTACCEGSGLSNRCLLSLNTGDGNALIRRFYYDVNEKGCKEFIYKGVRGNENNFMTKSECEKECIKVNNVCTMPIEGAESKECSRDEECGNGQWCHIGATSKTSICCGGAAPDPCTLPLETGEGTEHLARWFADPSDSSCNRQCRSFTYKGSKGNQNNFISKEQCEKRCKPQCMNVCGNSSVLLNSSGRQRRCGPVTPCPNDYWCHVGGNDDSTVCCSGTSDICKLSLARGTGDYHLTRWHFSTQDNKCISFIYHGIGGNQNMFLTLDDCRNSCPAYENPCGSGEPLMVDNKPKLCSPDSRCPSTHFCHIGIGNASSYCCPKDGDPCNLPVAKGIGSSLISRFYFDNETRRCHEFVYHGQKGNANNFLSKKDCESFCPVIPNPCIDGEPLLNSEKEPVICGGMETCPGGYYCHVGGSPETTNCCPGSRRACDKPLEVGKGNERLERWYFDGGVQLCKKFIYRGVKGNVNNFLSRAACQEACKEMNPCDEGTPLVDSNGERTLCTGGQRIDSCPSTHYCHVGASSLTTLCCKRKEIDPCDQERAEGYGNEALPRWYFDSQRGKCAQFQYGGMGGNENNFISRHTCEQTCPERRSYCPHGQPLFEPNGHQPISCGINKACPTGFICHMSAEYNVSVCCQDPMDFCLQPRDPGPCSRFEKRYGYHPLSDTCVEYEYGGCGGTLNNFKTLQRCTEICCKDYQ